MTQVSASTASITDLFLVVLLAAATQFAAHLSHPILDGVRRAIDGVPAPIQMQVDLWDWLWGHPWWAAAAALTIVPAVDAIVLRFLGARDVSFRQAQRTGVLSLAPLALLLPLQIIIILLWFGLARAWLNKPVALGFLYGSLALGFFGLLLPFWVLGLRVRLLNAFYKLGAIRASLAAVGPPIVGAVLVAVAATVLATPAAPRRTDWPIEEMPRQHASCMEVVGDEKVCDCYTRNLSERIAWRRSQEWGRNQQGEGFEDVWAAMEISMNRCPARGKWPVVLKNDIVAGCLKKPEGSPAGCDCLFGVLEKSVSYTRFVAGGFAVKQGKPMPEDAAAPLRSAEARACLGVDRERAPETEQ